MSVKIDQNRLPGDSDAAKRLESSRRTEETKQQPRAGRAAAAGSGTDRVEVSQHAQLLAAALKTADQLPDVRVDAVERARRALDAGDVGRDLQALADRIIDSLMGER